MRLKKMLFAAVALSLTALVQPAVAQWDDTKAPTLTLVWQTEFNAEAALLNPGDMAVDEWGNVFVSTQSSNTVKKFDSSGQFVTQWGKGGKGEGQFSLSFGLDLDSQGNVYVTDFYNLRVQKFDGDGNFLMEWDTEPTTSPAFLVIDHEDNIYIDQFPPYDEHYIMKFDSTGKLVDEWGKSHGEFDGRIEDIAVDPEGNVYVADPVLHRVEKLSPEGELLAVFGGETSTEGNGLFFDPFGITVDHEGYVYVLDRYNLQKLDSDGNFVAQWSTVGGDLDKATNITVDANGDLYVFARADVLGVNGDPANVLVLKRFSQS